MDPSTASFTALTSLLDTTAHAYAFPEGDAAIAAASELALKDVFNLALSTEAPLLPHVHKLLLSLLPEEPSPEALEAAARLEFPPTPLTALYTDGMDVDQIWEQLEMRAAKVVDVLEEVGVLDDLDRDEGSLTNEEKLERGMIDSDDEENDEEGSEGGEELSFEGMDDLEDSGDSEDEDGEELEDGLSADEDEEEGDSEDDDEMMDDEDEEEDEDEEDDEDDDTERRVRDLDASGQSSASRRSHPTLDDPFFSLHEFNRETEELEAFEVSDGKLGLNNDDDEDDEEDDDDEEDMMALLNSAPKKEVNMWSSVEGDGEGGTDEVKYSDFFAPPAKVYKPAAPAGSSQKSKGKGKGKAKAPSFDDMDDMDDMDEDQFGEEQDGDEDEGEFDEGDSDEFADEEDDLFDPNEDGTDITTRAKGDLFADEDDDGDAAPLSTHAARLAQLSEQIKALEDENVGVKPWALAGEASSKSRPINAILEEDLEFENVGKQVPVVTEEKVKGLEDKIKQRILDNDFNDVLRRRALDSKPFLPSRVFELEDQQSTKSLAQIYEDEYTASTSKLSGGAGAPIDDRDGKLLKEHTEIESAWSAICYKLDSLSNANFTPKAPSAKIETLTNGSASLAMETALPPTMRAGQMMAPEEVFQPPTAGELRAKSEMTPQEKRVQRGKEKKFKRKQRDRLEGAVDKFDKYKNGRKGAKGEKGAKEEALRGLVKEGRGVTIIGKDAKKFDKKGKREVAAPMEPGTKYKL